MSAPDGSTRRRRILLGVLLAALIALPLLRLACTSPSDTTPELAGKTMGTTWSVKIADAALTHEGLERARAAIDAELELVNGLMSTWDPASELSRFNRHASTEPFAVSEPTLEVLVVAREVSERSGGAFDVTVGPLVDAWGFGAGDRAPQPPGAREAAELGERVGYRLLEVDPKAGTLRKRHPETRCDLSAIAKGYAVDRVANALAGLGHANFLVEIGGELQGRGRRLDGRAWQVAIEAPDRDARSIHRVIGLQDASMATSGDYRNFYEREGVWVSHLIDPRAGRPISHALASVSVVHAEAMWADAWATTLIVLGPDEGPALAEREGLAAYFIERGPEGELRTHATPAFEPLLGLP